MHLVLFDGIANNLLGIDAATFKEKVDEGELDELNAILERNIGVQKRFRLRCKRTLKEVKFVHRGIV